MSAANWGLRLLAAVVAALLAAHGLATAAPAKQAKKLIEFGWDEPDTRFLRAHISEMQASPFDGCVFDVGYRLPNGTARSFSWDLWGRSRFRATDLDSARADLRATRFGRFRENFPRVNVTPGELDWFEDHSAVMNNLELAARLARDGGCPGILFDVEPYRGKLWDYKAKTKGHPRSWDSLATQVRKRGAEAMQALERGYPGLTVFMSLAYSMPLAQTYGGRGSLKDAQYALLAPFLDGMISVASDSVVIVDGHELSYPFRDPAQFAAKADSMRHGVLRIVAQPDRYARRLSVGFGIWLDNDMEHLGWNAQDPEQNYFTPRKFAVAVQAAFDNADRYVWIYNEKPRWWSASGRPEFVPASYDSVLRTVRR